MQRTFLEGLVIPHRRVEINLSPAGVFPKPIERGSRTSDQVGSLLVQGGALGVKIFSSIPLDK